VELAGAGSIVLNANGTALSDAAIYDNGYSNLTQDSGHSITGTGQITVNAFTNNGTVNANSSGNTLLLTRAAFTNTNLMEATGGGILQLNAGFTNTGGTISANGGTVLLNGGTITGGVLTSVTGSEIDEQSNTTLNGPTANTGVTLSNGSNLNVLDGNSLYLNATTITNNGTITINKGGTNTGTGIAIIGTVDLTGTGSIVLNASTNSFGSANIFDANSSNLTQEAQHTISGAGQIAVNVFTNKGTVDANLSGNTLRLINAAYTNTNLMEATNSGILPLNANFTNTGGTIKANGGTVQLIGGSVTGGTLTSITGSEIDEQSSTTLGGVTLSSGSNLKVLDGNNLLFAKWERKMNSTAGMAFNPLLLNDLRHLVGL